MIENPLNFISAFVDAGADLITFHLETVDDPSRAIREIKKLGVKAGVSIHPDTPVDKLFPILPEVDLVLIMSVAPGFGGQKYMAAATDRIRRVRVMLDQMWTAE